MRLVTNSFAPLARIFGKSEYSLYRLSLSRQLSATLSATACKYLAAVGRGHTLTEAVLLGALTLLGLIGTEHCMTPPSFVRSGGRKSLCRTYSTAGGKHSPTAAVDIRQALKISAFVIIHELFPPVNKNLKGKRAGSYEKRCVFSAKA